MLAVDSCYFVRLWLEQIKQLVKKEHEKRIRNGTEEKTMVSLKADTSFL